MYFDPLHSLSESAQKDWQDPKKQQEMIDQAMGEAMASQGKR